MTTEDGATRSARCRSVVDLHLVLRRDDEVLLGMRQNTGFADGCWHPPAGHMEDGESALSALVRECGEELGVRIEPSDAELVHLMHHRTDCGRIALFFEVRTWSGEPVTAEPEKCAEWRWFAFDALPADIVPYAADALAYVVKRVSYSERGWIDTGT